MLATINQGFGVPAELNEANNTINETLAIIKLTVSNLRTWILTHCFKQLLCIILSVSICIVAVMLYPNLKEISFNVINTTDAAKSFVVAKMIGPISDFENLPFDYVPRDRIEKQVLRIITSDNMVDGSYCIVYGSKGAGKSAVINHLLQSEKGVFKIDVGDITSKENMLLNIARKCGINSFKFPLTERNFVAALGEVGRQLGSSPIIVFEIERSKGQSDNPSTISAVRSLAKAAAWSAHVLIILSEANAVLEFGYDRQRERFVFVDEMTESEASTMLKNKFTTEEKQLIFSTVGTSPVLLRRLLADVPRICTLQESIRDILASARRDLLIFPLQPIIQALKEHPEGVSPDYFNNQEYKGINLSDYAAVGVYMKRSNALVYRIELGMYQLMSTAHKTALETYKPTAITA
jgi:hypothetical protein